MILNVLEKDLSFAGVQFDDIDSRVQVVDENLKTLTDIDVVMRNGNTTALIEVKHRVEKKDVNELLYNKLALVKKYYPKLKDYKIILGIGGGSFEDGAKQKKMILV